MLNKRSAFTLVELLVVIAIIVILASMILAGFSRARDAAHMTVCRSNLKQIGIGLANYVTEYKCFPRYAGRDELWWHQALEPYVGAVWPMPYNEPVELAPKTRLYQCPSYARALLRNGRLPIFNDPGQYSEFGGYGYNSRGVGWFTNANLGLGGYFSPENLHIPATKEHEVSKPAMMIAISDAAISSISIDANQWVTIGDGDLTRGFGRFAESGIPLNGASSYNNYRWASTIRRHHEQWNVAFCDGHVNTFKNTKLFWDSHDEAVLRRFNKDNLPHADIARGNLP